MAVYVHSPSNDVENKIEHWVVALTAVAALGDVASIRPASLSF